MPKTSIQDSNPKGLKQDTKTTVFNSGDDDQLSLTSESRKPSKGFIQAIKELDSGKGEYFKSIDDFEASWK